MTAGRHRDPASSARDRRTINALAAAAVLLIAASLHGIVTAPSTPNVNTSIGHGAPDVLRIATSWLLSDEQARTVDPDPRTAQGHTEGHTEEQP